MAIKSVLTVKITKIWLCLTSQIVTHNQSNDNLLQVLSCDYNEAILMWL